MFGALLPEQQTALTDRMECHVHPAGSEIARGDELREYLRWLLEGEVDLLDKDGDTVVSLRPGDCFGLRLGLGVGATSAVARAQAQTATVPAAFANELRDASAAMRYFLPPAHNGVPAAARDKSTVGLATGAPSAAGGGGDTAELNLMTSPVRALVKRAPITLPPETPIVEAARLMSEQRVSSVLITQDEKLWGVMTDRDLRNRVVAAGLDIQQPVSAIATQAPMTIDMAKPAFDALLLMARHNIHHVPVLDGERVAGMITATDLTERQSTSAVHLASEIYKKTSVEGLQTAAAKIGRLQQSLASAEASAYSTGHIVTAMTDAITVRLLQLGEEKLGKAPIPYVWVAAGSQARSEQTAKSDQDNCMVLDDSYDEARHGEYFKALSQFVCDGLDACGYVYCPGDMMAMTDTWRQPRRKWAEYFSRWTGSPDPKSLMLTCVFFDLRAIHGDAALLDGLRREVLDQTKGNSIFLAYMVGNAMQHQPPLGMFKGISTIRSGEHKGTIDLKHTGVVPVVDLARVYALAGGHEAVNTTDRLTSAAAGGAITEERSRDLRDALEFLAYTRIQHQARQIASGDKPDNYLNPDEVSNFERSQLKDAFHVVQSLQNVLGQRYQAGRF
ncbi:DUF294 nucleotidyltransferase-like domain-containing protein [Hydrogenophaga sp. 5NK40-0174]